MAKGTNDATLNVGAKNNTGKTFDDIKNGLASIKGAADQMASKINAASQKTGINFQSLTKFTGLFGLALGGLGVGAVATKLITLSGELTNLQSKLRFATTGTQNLKDTQTALFDVAAQTGSAMADVVDAYTKVSVATDGMGKSQQDNIAITKAILDGLDASGSDAAASAGAVDELTKSMTKGKVEGDGFLNVLQKAPVLAQQIASSMGISTTELKNLALQGKLTADQVTTALQDAAPDLAAAASTVPMTMDKAMTMLQSSLMSVVAEFRAAGDDGNIFADIVVWVSQKINDLATFLRDNRDQIAAWRNFFTSSIKLVWNVVKVGFNGIIVTTKLVGKGLMGLASAALAAFSGNWQGVKDAYKDTIQSIKETDTSGVTGAIDDIMRSGLAAADALRSVDEAKISDRQNRGTRGQVSSTRPTAAPQPKPTETKGGSKKEEKEKSWEEVVPGAKTLLDQLRQFDIELKKSLLLENGVDGADQKIIDLQQRFKDLAKTLPDVGLSMDQYEKAIDDITSKHDGLSKSLEDVSKNSLKDYDKQLQQLNRTYNTAAAIVDAQGEKVDAIILPKNFKEDLQQGKLAVMRMLAQLETEPQTDATVARIEELQRLLGGFSEQEKKVKEVERAKRQAPTDKARKDLETGIAKDAQRGIGEQSVRGTDMRDLIKADQAAIQTELGQLDLTNEEDTTRFLDLSNQLRGLGEMMAEQDVRFGSFGESFRAQLALMSEDTQSFSAILGSSMATTMDTFMNNSTEAFGQVIAGQKTASEAMKQLATETLATEATALGKKFLIKAKGALAEGIAGSPKGFAAAAAYAAAAALAFGVAGKARGSGGGGGGGKSANDQSEMAAKGERGTTSIYLENGILDMNDPRSRSRFANAIRDSKGNRIEVFGGSPR